MQFRVSDRGFSLDNVNITEGRRGYIISCDVFKDYSQICTYYDAGDGGEPYITPVNGWTHKDLEKAVSCVPEGNTVPLLVEHLINLQEMADIFIKRTRMGLDGALAEGRIKGTPFMHYAVVPSDYTKAMAEKFFMDDFSENHVTRPWLREKKVEVKLYTTLSDFRITGREDFRKRKTS